MADLTCDVAVIGAGTAGIAAERRARKAGARTLLIDPHFAGTTCASVGCMPSKLLIAAADAAWSVRDADTFGVRAPATVDGAAVMRRVRDRRDAFVAGVKTMIAAIPAGTCIMARARFAGPDALALDDGRRVTARAIVIATGARPVVPKSFDAVKAAVLTNETVFDLTGLPDSVAVIGAGPLGLELAQALARLGVRVAVFDRGTGIAHVADPAAAAALKRLLGREVTLHLGAEPEVAPEGHGVRLSWDGGAESFDRLLVAAGRRPALDGLDLAAAGLALSDGVPDFDRRTLQCGASPIFIAGDANEDRPLLHEAAHEGSIAGRNAAAHPDVRGYTRHVPFSLTFTRPEIAVLGEVPDDDDTDVAIAQADYGDQGRAEVQAVAGGLCRLYARRRDGRLIGATLCAPEAGHLAHLLAWAIEFEATVGTLLGMPFYHPTLEEGLKPALKALCGKVGQPSDETRRAFSPCS